MRDDKPYHHGHLRDALISTGLRLIDREGLQALSIRRLAAEVGVSHTAPNYHFANKKELVAAISTEGFRIYNRAIAPILEEPDADGRFIELGWRYFRFASEHSAYYRLIFGSGGETCYSEELAVESSRAFDSLISTVAYYLRSHGIGGDDFEKRVSMSAILIWSHIHGTVMLWFNDIWSMVVPGIDQIIEEQGYIEAFRPIVENMINHYPHYILEFARGEISDWGAIDPMREHAAAYRIGGAHPEQS